MGKFFFLNFNDTSDVLSLTRRTACPAPPHDMKAIVYLCTSTLRRMNKYAPQSGENAAAARDGFTGANTPVLSVSANYLWHSALCFSA